MIINDTFLAACGLAADGNIRPTLANIEVDKNLTTRVTNSFVAGRFTNKFENYNVNDYPDLRIGSLKIKDKFLLPVKFLNKLKFKKNKYINILDKTKIIGEIKENKIVFWETDLETENIEKLILPNNNFNFPDIDKLIEIPENNHTTRLSIENLLLCLKAAQIHGASAVDIYVSDKPLEPFIIKGVDYYDYWHYTDTEPQADFIIMPLKI